MLYGFSKWSRLITEYNDGSEEQQKESEINNLRPCDVVDAKYYRLPLWVLFLGIGINLVIGLIQSLLGY